jgi:hypothetical protein
MGGLELASVVRQLRQELTEAMEEGDGERLRFDPGVPVRARNLAGHRR